MTVRWSWDVDPGAERHDPEVLRRLRERIDQVIAENEEDYVGFLAELLRAPTISGALDREGERRFREAMDECMARVEMEAERLGLQWRSHEGIAAVAEWPGRRGQYKSIGVAAHLDVVPPGGTWTHPAFGGEVRDDEVWGRGAQDDKGGVVMALAAMDVLQRLGLKPRSDLRLFLGTQEETDDWLDMDLLLEREQPPDLTLVPDGAFPVIVGEKGLATVEWSASWQPARSDGFRFVSLQGGERHNQVPSRAVLTVACRPGKEDDVRRRLESLEHVKNVRPARDPPPSVAGDPAFELVFAGKAAHGAFPDHGHNAVIDALKALHELLGDQGAGSFARFLLDTCSESDGSGLMLDQEHTMMGPTTLNLGVAYMGATRGHVELSVRFPLGLHLEEVRSRFREASKQVGNGLSVQYMTRGRPHEPLFVSPEDHPRTIHSLQAAYETGTGREPTLASIAGTTYAKVFPFAVAFGPQDESAGEEILAHETDERVSLERLRENIRVYALALALLAFDEEEVERVAQELSSSP